MKVFATCCKQILLCTKNKSPDCQMLVCLKKFYSWHFVTLFGTSKTLESGKKWSMGLYLIPSHFLSHKWLDYMHIMSRSQPHAIFVFFFSGFMTTLLQYSYCIFRLFVPSLSGSFRIPRVLMKKGRNPSSHCINVRKLKMGQKWKTIQYF